jgi:hypothetical protein
MPVAHVRNWFAPGVTHAEDRPMSVHSRKPSAIARPDPPAFSPGVHAAARLARLFNIPDAGRVLSLTLECPADGLVAVAVTLAAEAGQLDRLESEVRRYAISAAPLISSPDA